MFSDSLGLQSARPLQTTSQTRHCTWTVKVFHIPDSAACCITALSCLWTIAPISRMPRDTGWEADPEQRCEMLQLCYWLTKMAEDRTNKNCLCGANHSVLHRKKRSAVAQLRTGILPLTIKAEIFASVSSCVPIGMFWILILVFWFLMFSWSQPRWSSILESPLQTPAPQVSLSSFAV